MLHLPHNAIYDVSPLRDTSIDYLDLTNNKIEDVMIICKNPRRIALKNNRIKLVQPLIDKLVLFTNNKKLFLYYRVNGMALWLAILFRPSLSIIIHDSYYYLYCSRNPEEKIHGQIKMRCCL